MLKSHFSLLLFFTTFLSFGQSQTLTESVYFDTDKWHLRAYAVAKLTGLTDSMQSLQIDSIFLSGNTDSRATNEYNIALSEKRTNQVSKFLNAAGFEHIPVRKDSYGEERPIASNDNDTGMQKNRRVDILVYHTVPLPKPDSIPEDPCFGDTTIILPNGTQLTFNTCEYLNKKDCMEFIEILDPEAAIRHGLNTTDNEGNLLISGGMVDFRMKEGCGELQLKHGCRIRIPCGYNPCRADLDMSPSLYDFNGSGWSQTEEELDVVEVNQVRFFEFNLFSPGLKNVDQAVLTSAEVKFKGPRGYYLDQVRLRSTCPFSVIAFNHEEEIRDRIIKDRRITCFFGSGEVDAVLINEEGDTLIMTPRPLNDLEKRYWRSNACGKSSEVEKKVLGIFPQRKRSIYRKYIIDEEDLIPINEVTPE